MNNRYLKKKDVKVGDRIIFDNKTGFLKDMLKIKMVGEIIDVDLEDNLISVLFKTNGINDPIIKSIPYFLCQ